MCIGLFCGDIGLVYRDVGLCYQWLNGPINFTANVYWDLLPKSKALLPRYRARLQRYGALLPISEWYDQSTADVHMVLLPRYTDLLPIHMALLPISRTV